MWASVQQADAPPSGHSTRMSQEVRKNPRLPTTLPLDQNRDGTPGMFPSTTFGIRLTAALLRFRIHPGIYIHAQTSKPTSERHSPPHVSQQSPKPGPGERLKEDRSTQKLERRRRRRRGGPAALVWSKQTLTDAVWSFHCAASPSWMQARACRCMTVRRRKTGNERVPETEKSS